MSITIRKPGILTTVQDLGRTGARNIGVNPGGVMDRVAARLINIILGNPESSPVLEMHFPAPEINFDDDTVFALGGADFDAEIDGMPLENWSTGFGAKGDTLRFKKKESGTRAYLSVTGGFKTEQWLGSSSANLMAPVGKAAGVMANGDRIECDVTDNRLRLSVGRSVLPVYSRFPTVRIVAGPEFDLLTATSEKLLLSEGFTLSRSCNRMGYRLEGKTLHLLDGHEMVSSAVTFGTVQLLPDGQLIVLMADHQTSGGYPRIGNVISTDLPLLAQCGPGDGVGFTIVSIEEAENASLQFERELNYLRVGCRLQRHNAHR